MASGVRVSNLDEAIDIINDLDNLLKEYNSVI